MALKVIGAGFGRTGTLSLYTALKQLGFPCYHMMEVIGNRTNASHLDFWHKVANEPVGARRDWETVFANYTAAVDNPASCVWQELADAYPDARIILTLHPRGADAWYESTIDTIYFTENRWQFKVLELTVPFARKFGDMQHKLIWQRAHRGTMNDRGRAIAFYKQHIEDVKAAIPADRLLIFSVDQGWEPLCKFLGLAVPAGKFPDVNDRAQIRKMLAVVNWGAYGILAIAALAAAALVYGGVRLLA
jgi:hypothetical protein